MKFEQFCDALDKPILGRPDLAPGLETDPEGNTIPYLDGFETDLVDVSVLNYAKYIREVCQTI